MPRKPLLGCSDELRIKQKRSFGFQAEQTVWDIGHPSIGVTQRNLVISNFVPDWRISDTSGPLRLTE